ncbi:Uncharacterized protein FWK35_00019236, partial [Aphis craccivora]
MSDKLKYNVLENKKVEEGTPVTKREMLSDIAAIFDPLGLVGPLIVKLTGTNRFHRIYKNNVTNNLKSCVIENHGFSDVLAYGCCLYLKCTNVTGIHHTSLICAKSKIAFENIIIATLEHCAALLLMHLTNKLIPKLHLKISQQYFRTDSKIVLACIASSSTKWRTFVAHRRAEIQNKTSMNEWNYVNTGDNPADVISRDSHLKVENIPEGKENSINVMCVIDYEDFILNKYESLTKCLRITTYCLRFINNARTRKNNNIKLTGFLIPEELEVATLKLIKNTQHIVTQYSQQLWRRWSREYLCQLLERSKWLKEKGPRLNVGTVVLVKEDNLPPLQWRLGLVNNVFRGSDGVIRSAEVVSENRKSM